MSGVPEESFVIATPGVGSEPGSTKAGATATFYRWGIATRARAEGEAAKWNETATREGRAPAAKVYKVAVKDMPEPQRSAFIRAHTTAPASP